MLIDILLTNGDVVLQISQEVLVDVEVHLFVHSFYYMVSYEVRLLKDHLILAPLNILHKVPSQDSDETLCVAFGHNLEDVGSRSLNDFHDFSITCKNAIDVLKHHSIDLFESILVIVLLTWPLFGLVWLNPTKFEVIATVYD